LAKKAAASAATPVPASKTPTTSGTPAAGTSSAAVSASVSSTPAGPAATTGASAVTANLSPEVDAIIKELRKNLSPDATAPPRVERKGNIIDVSFNISVPAEKQNEVKEALLKDIREGRLTVKVQDAQGKEIIVPAENINIRFASIHLDINLPGEFKTVKVGDRVLEIVALTSLNLVALTEDFIKAGAKEKPARTTPDQLNAKKFEEKDQADDPVCAAPLVWMEDNLASTDERAAFGDIVSGKVAYFKFAAGEASRLWKSFVKAGIISKEEAKDPRVQAMYRMWNIDLWDVANKVRANIPALQKSKAEWEAKRDHIYTKAVFTPEEIINIKETLKNKERMKVLSSDEIKELTEALDEIDDLTVIIIGFTQANVIPGLDLILNNPTCATSMKLGVRHIMSLKIGIMEAALKFGMDPVKALEQVRFNLTVTNALAPDVIADLKALDKEGVLGFKLANIKLIVNDNIPGCIRVGDELLEMVQLVNKDGKVIADKNPNPNHGFNIIYAETPSKDGIFKYNAEKKDFERVQESVFQSLEDAGVETIVIHRTNDMIMFIPECALDLQVYAIFRKLRNEGKIDQLVEVLNNFTGEKGGLAASTKKLTELGLMFLAEGLAVKSPKAQELLARIRKEVQDNQHLKDIPYNRMYHYIDLKALRKALKANQGILPASVKDDKPTKGIWSLEIPTGDLTMLPGMRTIALIRHHDYMIDNSILAEDAFYKKNSGSGAEIHDFKQ
ncbi:MAG: hypothetical protein WCL25_05590, partial [bacterium]